MTRLSGHGLLYEGRTRGNWRSERMGPGPGICSCGEESPVLPTTAARQRWHREEHKPAVIRGREVMTFTKKQRRQLSDSYGHRPVNNWGDGDLPAPWANGDLVELPEGVAVEGGRLDGTGPRVLVVCSAFSIDEGDGWYFRVTDGQEMSDRLHVVTQRSDWDTPVDFMAPFRLLDTSDPEGLAKREAMLAAGWSYEPTPRCPTCGAVDLRAKEEA